MSYDQQKYVENGTGQVGYLRLDYETNAWVFELFVARPQPYQPVRVWARREDAEKALTDLGFKSADE